MTSEPLLHPSVAKQFEYLKQQPVHGLLLTGDPGSGKSTLARWLAAQILGLTLESLANYPYLTIIQPEKDSIGVEAVRTLEHVLSLKTAQQGKGIARMIIIEDAHQLTLEAQNALLKTLEEPPAGTMLLLTATRSDSLLPTVRSRLQTIDIGRPSAEAVQQLLTQRGVPSRDITRIMALSGGLPGLAIALAEGDDSHALAQAAVAARELLQKASFERLALVDRLSKDRVLSRNVIFILMQMAHAALLSGRGAQRWQKVLTASYEAETLLSKNAQAKLVLTNLMLNL